MCVCVLCVYSMLSFVVRTTDALCISFHSDVLYVFVVGFEMYLTNCLL